MATKLDLINQLSSDFSKSDLTALSKSELQALLGRVSQTKTSDFQSGYISDLSNKRKNDAARTLMDAVNKVSPNHQIDLNSARTFIDKVSGGNYKLYGNDADTAQKVSAAWKNSNTGGTAYSAYIDAIRNSGLNPDPAYYNGQTDNSIPDYTDYTGQINSLLDKQVKDQTVNDFLTALPSDLSKNREDYLRQLQDYSTQNYNEDIAPAVQATINTRGLLFSGDLPDALGQAAIDVQSNLDQARIDLESQDNELFFNAAYQKKVQDLLDASTNYKSDLANERSNVLTQQNQRFTSNQNDLNAKLQQKLLLQSLDRQEALNKAQLEQQKNKLNKQNTSNLIGGIGQGIGTVVGASAGGPVGAAVGSQAGSGIGNITSDSIS